jgi:hypothetical protein
MGTWNSWYHCTTHAYGSWLRGDPRGWRSRHDREHVDGDYRNPPPDGLYEKLHERSKRLMKRTRVRFDRDIRATVLLAVVERLQMESIPVAVASLNSSHPHVLARFDDQRCRWWIGRAKYHASMLGKKRGIAPAGGYWAKLGGLKPNAYRAHQIKTITSSVIATKARSSISTPHARN